MIDRLAPARRPRGRFGGYQTWEELLFLHWELPAAEIARTLPDGLELDLFDDGAEGRAFVGLVAFTMRGVRPWWAPAVPGIADFHELNLRTYVLCRNEPGVWFYSLDAASSVAVVAARTGWHLPYHRARMTLAREGDDVRYASTRRWPKPLPAELEVAYRIGAPLCVLPGSLEHFLVERYLLFAQRGGALLRGQVHHEPYPLHEAKVDLLGANTVPAAAGFVLPDDGLLAHYSPGVDVDVYALTPAR